MKYLFIFICCGFAVLVNAQQFSYSDPAQAYNRLLVERNSGTYTRVGAYKVIGSPYLFGEKRKGDVYTTKEKGNDIQLSYNTYSQDIEFVLPDVSKTLEKKPGTVDSFIIRKDAQLGMAADLKFIYGKLLGSGEKNYFQEVVRGPKVSLYKKYSAQLGNVSTNYVQSDLRQFDISVDYYYQDAATPDKLTKLKTNKPALVKEFSKLKNLESVIDEDALVTARDSELVKLFSELNKD
jgi:ABC-type sulfate transport system substrate-binding protein